MIGGPGGVELKVVGRQCPLHINATIVHRLHRDEETPRIQLVSDCGLVSGERAADRTY